MSGRIRHASAVAAAIGVAIIGLGVVAFLLWGRATYGVFGWTTTPTRLGYCDQTYTLLDDQARSWERVLGRDPQAATAVVLEPTIGTLPIGGALPSSYAPGAGYNGCGQLVVLHVESSFRLYYKLGGP